MSCFLHGSPEYLAQEEQQEMFTNVSRCEQSNKQSGFGREFPLLSPIQNKKGKEGFSQYSFWIEHDQHPQWTCKNWGNEAEERSEQ